MTLVDAERLISASPDYRLLRRVPEPGQWKLERGSGETRPAILVDTETTGLDQDADEMIELALLPFEYERDTGRIVSVDEANALSGFREPSKLIPQEATQVHGVTNDMVKGQVI